MNGPTFNNPKTIKLNKKTIDFEVNKRIRFIRWDIFRYKNNWYIRYLYIYNRRKYKSRTHFFIW